MKQDQIILIALIIILGVFLVFILYIVFSKLNKNKKEKKIDKFYNPENLVEQNAFDSLNKPPETTPIENQEEKQNKFFN